MAQAGYTPVLLYGSTTTGNTPSAANLTTSASGVELAINAFDGKLFYKDNAGVVQVLATKASAISPVTNNGVVYVNSSGQATTGSALTFDGTNLGVNSPILAARTLSVKGRAAFTATANDSQLAIYSDGSTNGLYSTYNSTGSYLPMTFWINDVEQMRLTSTGLGIGTSSPATRLQVVAASANSTGAKIGGILYSGTQRGLTIKTYQSNGGDDCGVEFNAADGLAGYGGFKFAANTTTLATLDPSGNLGLGVTPSAWNSSYSQKAFQFGPVGSISSLQASTTNNQTYLNSNAVNLSGGWTYMYSDLATQYRQYAGTHAWYNAPSGTAGNAITFTQAMTLDASGNLFLGRTTGGNGVLRTLSQHFDDQDLRGNVTISDSAAYNANPEAGVAFITNYTASADANMGSISVGKANTTSGNLDAYMRFVVRSNSAGNIERARIDSSGNLLVGTTSGSTNTFVKGVTDIPALIVRNNLSSGNLFGINANFSNLAPNNTTSFFLQCNDTGAERATIRSNGGLANYQANDVNLSDRREKTNFAPAKSYLDTICAIPVQTFNYIDQNMEDDPGLTLGVVAQDVQAVAPELVSESNWGTEDEPKMRLSIYQTDLQYALMKALQELKAEFDAYKATHP